jgi:hypothetical protein
MRSTRATAAVTRLKQRAGSENFSMVRSSEELFYLTTMSAEGTAERLNAPMALDDFVKFVNAYGPQTPRRVSKLDVAFEKQLSNKK